MKFFQKMLQAYIIIGGIFASATVTSGMLFYGFGPGAFWNIGFMYSILGTAAAIFFSLARIFVWPLGILQIASTELTFWKWINYVWYT